MSVGPALPGETRQDFIRRVLDAAPKPTSELMERMRQLLPPVPTTAKPLGRAS
jgi:hypothetical protein